MPTEQGGEPAPLNSQPAVSLDVQGDARLRDVSGRDTNTTHATVVGPGAVVGNPSGIVITGPVAGDVNIQLPGTRRNPLYNQKIWPLFLALAMTFGSGTFLFFAAPRGPARMDRFFNIAIADFGKANAWTDAEVMGSQDGEFLAKELASTLEALYSEHPYLAGKVGIQRVAMPVSGSSVALRHEAARQLAETLNADVVIYGVLLPSAFLPEYYVNPRLNGAEESLGPNAFGKAIADVWQPFASADGVENRFSLERQVLPRLEALSDLLIGLAYFKAGLPDQARRLFNLALERDGWEEADGKEILYLWIGSAHLRRVSEGLPIAEDDLLCPQLAGEQTGLDDWQCAELAYTRALSLTNGQYARAHIGLGNLWLNRAELKVAGLHGFACEGPVDKAIDHYSTALRLNRAADGQPGLPELALVTEKARFNLGLLQATLYLEGCAEEEAYQTALGHFAAVIRRYRDEPDAPFYRELAAEALFQSGHLRFWHRDFEGASKELDECIFMAAPRGAPEAWQAVRWSAHVWLGLTYLEVARQAPQADYEPAREQFATVIAANEKRDQSLEPDIVGRAYWGAGQLEEDLHRPQAAAELYQRALGVPGLSPIMRQSVGEQLAALGGSP